MALLFLSRFVPNYGSISPFQGRVLIEKSVGTGYAWRRFVSPFLFFPLGDIFVGDCDITGGWGSRRWPGLVSGDNHVGGYGRRRCGRTSTRLLECVTSHHVLHFPLGLLYHLVERFPVVVGLARLWVQRHNVTRGIAEGGAYYDVATSCVVNLLPIVQRCVLQVTFVALIVLGGCEPGEDSGSVLLGTSCWNAALALSCFNGLSTLLNIYNKILH